jgi:hypothetical protein
MSRSLSNRVELFHRTCSVVLCYKHITNVSCIAAGMQDAGSGARTPVEHVRVLCLQVPDSEALMR